MRLRISARKSDLARLQAYQVGQALGGDVDYLFRESLGDKNLNDPLWKMPEKGVFTEDFQTDLLQGKTDMVVHSWKDLPLLKADAPTEIIATLPREDARDLLLFKNSSLEKLKNHLPMKVFSSSPRRQYNLTPFLESHLPYGRQKLEFLPVRGNIQTRVKKMLEDPNVDALVLAKAALDRLLTTENPEFQTTKIFLQESLNLCQWMVLPLSLNPTAAAQGALAIEALKSRTDLKALVQKINDPDSFACAQMERDILGTYGGGCHQKIGVSVLKRYFGDVVFLKGLTETGEKLDSKKTTPPQGLVTLKTDDLFVREEIAAEIPKDVDALFVSHAAAWLPQFQARILWSAGLSTWRRLADLGHWVSGSSESLGESEDRRLFALAPNKKWAKLSHQSPSPSELKVISTYQLVPKAPAQIPLANAYYWKSFLLYQRAIELHPEIKAQKHFCGPGKTFEEIKKLDPRVQVLFPPPLKGN
jgi:hydroxymethylbilane synthase